jgi:exosortase A
LASLEQGQSTSVAWKRSGPAAALALVALLLIFWPTTVFTVLFWEGTGYSHGYLIVPISLYIVWECRTALAQITPRVQAWGPVLLLGLSILWALAHLVGVQLVMQLALFFAVGVMLWTLLGSEAFKLLAFPFGYLLLAIPIWTLAQPFLQENTAVASTGALRSFGVPVYLETVYIAIPSGQFVVAEMCSGLSYFLAALAVATLFAYLNYRRVTLGALFVAVVVAISIILNWVRVIIIILAGHLSSMDHFLVKEHANFGWVLFTIALVPIFLFGNWLRRFDHIPDDGRPASAVAAERIPESRSKFFVTTVIALLAVAIGPATVLWAASKPAPMADIHLQAPLAEAPWAVTDRLDTRWGAKFLNPDAQVLATYVENGALVSLYIAYYADQRQGAEAINEQNTLYDENRWQPRRQADRRVALADGTVLVVREIELVAGNGAERLVWYWYRMGDKRTTSPVVAKLWQLANSLTGSLDGAVIAVSSRRHESLDTTRADLEQFLVLMEPRLVAAINRAMTR